MDTPSKVTQGSDARPAVKRLTVHSEGMREKFAANDKQALESLRAAGRLRRAMEEKEQGESSPPVGG